MPRANDPAAAASPGREVFRALARAVWRRRARAGLALALLVASKLAFVGVPALLKQIVDRFSHPESLGILPVFLLLAYALLRLAGGVFNELRDIVFSRISERIVADYTRRAFAHLHALGARFHLTRQTGGVVRDVERGTAGIGFLLGMALLTILPTLVEIGAVVAIIAAAYAWPFIAIIIVTFVAYTVATRLLTERRAALQRQRIELDARANGRIVDSLLNYETVKAFANERYESQRLDALLEERQSIALRTQHALSTLHVAQSTVIAAGVGAVMLYAGQRVAAGILTVGDLVLINSYILQVCLPLNSLGFVFRQAKDAMLDVERLLRLLRQPADVIERPGMPTLQVTRGEVRFEAVSFGYDAARQVLWDVDFTIPPGGTVAVVGGSGSGKSTLARLLLRFYDPQQGRVLIDGRDIREVTQASLRQQIGIVPQDTVLFNDSIAYNIAYGQPGLGAGRPPASLASVIDAARAAHVHEFIGNLPEQYDTPVGERGLKLSGGEKQRLAIARALLRNPPILIFDEATSALDTRSERAIQAELDRISRDRTTLVIAHRLSTVVDADQILVLERGRVVERGRHAELLAADGLYAQMWALQQTQGEIEKTEQKLAMQPVNLLALLAGVVDALRPVLEARSITLYTALDEQSSRVTGDPSGLQKLFWDLCTSVIDLSAAGGRIELEVERAGPHARVVVAGQRAGAGEPPPAPRASELPLDPLRARSVVELNRGTLDLAEHSDGALRYCVELPLRAVDEIRPAREKNGVRPFGSLDGLRVMAIDDEDDAREALGAVLESRGARVQTARSGHAAIEQLARLPSDAWPEVLICDIALGDESGYDVLRQLRALEGARDVALERRLPAVALTGYAGADDRMRALMAGFQIHLAKPVDPEELVATVGTLARRKPAARAH
ncbi:ATP-binding cassette domain-containing protein [Solimonas soli]|uniref:ATP-binding cassette domain-containing protein n=1 Tax=Solimonas soli TaxID=413479 RepID=UPI0004BA3162|nr:ATP-binding cassette domain-containing protein [Solimonas soli]